MKKFNLKLITPLILTLILQGCMPDSLTKFKKETPKKTATAPVISAPVVDSSGTLLPFTPPTYVFFGTTLNSKFNFTVQAASTSASINLDGSLRDKTTNSQFIIGCSLDTSGNSQTTILPSGLTLDPSLCSISGTATVNKSVVTPFCSNSAYSNQTDCESAPLVWNGTTCSDSDFQYSNQVACEAEYNIWYAKGSQIPYKVKLTYKDSAGTIYNVFATARIGSYTQLTSLPYTQSERLSLPVTASVNDFNVVAPIRTTTASVVNYLAANIISSQGGMQGVVNYVDQSLNLIGIKRLIKMTLSNATLFNAGSFITTSGNAKIGRIFKKDSSNQNIIYVENISGGELYFDVGNQIDYVYPYVAGHVHASITAIDENQLFNTTTSANLDNDLQFYSSKITLTGPPTNSYLANSLTDIKSIKPIIAIATNNGVEVTISPKLPDGLTLDSTTGIISGRFLKSLPSTSFTITASNPLGEITRIIKLAASDAPADLSLSTKQILNVSSTIFFTEGENLFQAIAPPLTDAPKGKILKILNGYQIAVDTSNGAFLAGASLDSGSGFFSEKAYIIPDNSCVNASYTTQADCEGAAYTWSTGPIFYNLALKLNTPTSAYYKVGTCSNAAYTTQLTCEAAPEVWAAGSCSNASYTTQASCESSFEIWGPTYVTSTGTAKAVLAGSYDIADYCSDPTYTSKTTCEANLGVWGSHTYLFVRHETQDTTGLYATGVSNAKTFSQGDTLVGSGKTVLEVDYNFIKMLLSNATTFKIGADVTTRDSAVPHYIQTGAYTYNKSVNTIYVSDISRSPAATLFKVGDSIYPDEVASAFPSAVTISSVTHDILIVAERGQKTVINTSVSAGNSIYSITPALPIGLSLDTKTGQISGTPTTLTPKKDFTLTATNFVGQATYVFSMEVRDYFTLSESSGAPSFLLHKVGDTQVDRKCRVNASDIISSNGTLLDVRCHLEAEEEDLNFNPIKFQASVGPGICQYIQYSPYYFWQYSPKQSADTSAAYPVATTVYTGCGAAGTAPTADMCDGNYAANGAIGPNCDEGKLKYFSQATTADATGVCLGPSGPITTNYISCGGKKINCIAGPVKDLLSDSQLDSGFRGYIYQTPNGINQNWTLSSPHSKGDWVNMRVANSTTKNKCATSNADVNTWTTKAATTSRLTAPFGDSSPYYVVSCLNAASQIKARIRVVVRDWDRNFKINYGIDLDNPNTTTSGVASDADGAFLNNSTADAYGYPFNNHNDWDNDYTNLGSCFTDAGFTIPFAGLTTEYSCSANDGYWQSAGANYTGASCGLKGAGVEYPYPQSSLAL